MNEIRVIALTVPPDVVLSTYFVDRLERMMEGRLGRAWRLHEWYEVEFDKATTDLPQQYEFVYVPDTRSEDERLADMSREESVALTLALPEINAALDQRRK